jgi:hypothetical protein
MCPMRPLAPAMAILSGLEELAMAEKAFNINEQGSQAVDRSEVLRVRPL